MKKQLALTILFLVVAGCHDSESYSPTAPAFQNALIVDIEQPTLPADGFSTIFVRGKIDPSADSGNRTLSFTTTDGSFVEAGATPKSVEIVVDSSGVAIAHLRSSQTPGNVQVMVRSTTHTDVSKVLQVVFTAIDPKTTIQLSSERSLASADTYTPTAIFAQLGAGVPQAGRSVVFTTTRGTFLQSGTATATVIADQSGRARVDIVGPQTPDIARVTAVAFNVTAEIFIQFVNALPDTILVKPAKLQLQQGIATDSTTVVAIEMYRSVGKVSTGLVPSVRVVDAATGADLQFLIRDVSPTTAAGVSQATITVGNTAFKGTARIEVRVDGTNVTGVASIEVIPKS